MKRNLRWAAIILALVIILAVVLMLINRTYDIPVAAVNVPLTRPASRGAGILSKRSPSARCVMEIT